MNPSCIIATCSISLVSHSDHLVPCGHKPTTLRLDCIHFTIEGKKKYCICQLVLPDVIASCYSLLCLRAYFISGKHCNSGRKFCLMNTNPPIMYSFFSKKIYICTGKKAK